MIFSKENEPEYLAQQKKPDKIGTIELKLFSERGSPMLLAVSLCLLQYSLNFVLVFLVCLSSPVSFEGDESHLVVTSSLSLAIVWLFLALCLQRFDKITLWGSIGMIIFRILFQFLLLQNTAVCVCTICEHRFGLNLLEVFHRWI